MVADSYRNEIADEIERAMLHQTKEPVRILLAGRPREFWQEIINSLRDSSTATGEQP
jgi:hypothetical protein